jgi:EAL domain-containing protein (putative c-di-GMP-specific phosphodiesterase class I)
MQMLATIKEALSVGGFYLSAQPIAPIAPGTSGERHYEILVSMVDDSGQWVSPSRFIPAAEHYILMPAVDRWIINHLFVQQGETLRAWHRRHPESFLFAVNLSGTTVADEGFRRFLRRQFEDCRIPYPSVCFEITETAAVGSLAGAAAFIQEFSALGCRFALDDFGTGLSSYAYLRTLGVHYLKIDGSFVRGLAEDPVNRALVESIHRVAQVLGLKTIAEWAEDEPTLAALRQIGVDYAQGYAVGAAVPLPAFSLNQAEAGPSDPPEPP